MAATSVPPTVAPCLKVRVSQPVHALGLGRVAVAAPVEHAPARPLHGVAESPPVIFFWLAANGFLVAGLSEGCQMRPDLRTGVYETVAQTIGIGAFRDGTPGGIRTPDPQVRSFEEGVEETVRWRCVAAGDLTELH